MSNSYHHTNTSMKNKEAQSIAGIVREWTAWYSTVHISSNEKTTLSFSSLLVLIKNLTIQVIDKTWWPSMQFQFKGKNRNTVRKEIDNKNALHHNCTGNKKRYRTNYFIKGWMIHKRKKEAKNQGCLKQEIACGQSLASFPWHPLSPSSSCWCLHWFAPAWLSWSHAQPPGNEHLLQRL